MPRATSNERPTGSPSRSSGVSALRLRLGGPLAGPLGMLRALSRKRSDGRFRLDTAANVTYWSVGNCPPRAPLGNAAVTNVVPKTEPWIDLDSPAARVAGAEPIPGYRLVAKLGQGGCGEVWKCEAPGGLPKAIKFVSGDMGQIDGASGAAR